MALLLVLLLLYNSQGSILYCPLRPGQALWLAPPTLCPLGTVRDAWKSATKVTSPELRTERAFDRLGEGERPLILQPIAARALQPRYYWSCQVGQLPLRAVVLKRPKVGEVEDTEGFTVLPKSCK